MVAKDDKAYAGVSGDEVTVVTAEQVKKAEEGATGPIEDLGFRSFPKSIICIVGNEFCERYTA